MIARTGATQEYAGDPTRTVHLTFQPIGGVGKTVVAWLLIQRHRAVAPGEELACFSADPWGGGLLKGVVGMRHVFAPATADAGQTARALDAMAEAILAQDRDVVIDTGAACCFQLWRYMVEDVFVDVLENAGRRLVVHVPVTGGTRMFPALRVVDRLANRLHRSVRFVVWGNEYFGPVTQDGIRLEVTEILRFHEERIARLVRLPDIKTALPSAVGVERLNPAPVARNRLDALRRAVFSQLEGL